MIYLKRPPMSCAAVTQSIVHHIRSTKLPTTNGTTVSPRSRTRAKKTGRLVEFNGRSQTLAQWAAEVGVSYACMQSRVKFGTPLDRPFSKAGRPKGYSPPAKDSQS